MQTNSGKVDCSATGLDLSIALLCLAATSFARLYSPGVNIPGGPAHQQGESLSRIHMNATVPWLRNLVLVA
ncbi:hypothetical protein N7497_005186 [Penicillium chrysogenum]|jgi:hypothetical protein|uniref:Uncharacterized protein n=1 Tax=Penicillium chrysogenum TaxID=5076 RepID=A0ABQ8WPJ1_PENCH|nr:hypothetical protein N7505_003128 [Penicillium chrysogenum]KAJ5285075.1 hypothetical protein N7524_000381 [Penicillium chrysogenum]KAJ6156301.1 hypothetical protein N7497_005186 [Penicillium chrysogenum]